MPKELNEIVEELTSYGVAPNPLKNARVALYLSEADNLRNMLQDYTRLGIYKLYPYEYQLLNNSCKMVAKSVQLAIDSDNINLSHIIDDVRLNSPMIWVDTESTEGWNWLPDSPSDIADICTSDIALDCFTSEWITKLGDKSLAEYYSKYGNVDASEYLLVDLWESLFFDRLVTKSFNHNLRVGAIISVISKYTMVSVVDSNLELLSCTSDALLPLAVERFKNGLDLNEYSNIANRVNKVQ